ncbi:MAG: ATP-binding protein [Clostridiales bacterium]|nr:ATP-binding protein [Clostridiales bacterium]
MIFSRQAHIEILPSGKVLNAKVGDSLLTLLLANHVLDKGQEAVRLEKGKVSAPNEPRREEERFSPTALADGWILASERRVAGNAVLYVPDQQRQDSELPIVDAARQPAEGLGLAVDLGSGTVAAGLADLRGMAIPAISACANSQCGALGDLGARLKFMREHEDGLKILQNMLYDDIKRLARRLSDKTGLDPRDVSVVMVAANSALGQMLWGEIPAGTAGWEACWRAPRTRQADQTPLAELMPRAEIVLMPSAAPDIGSDLVAAILASGLEHKIERPAITLMIDLGLSTEIVAAGRGRLLVASVSTPALEGVSISDGMRATVGAIVQVQINDTVLLRTVRDARPRGLSGAGLISAVYALQQNDLLDSEGRIIFDRDLPPRLIAHFARGFSGVDFLLSRRGAAADIVIEQNDIRQLQLAKGSVYAACKAVLAELKADERDIGQILVGESFGAHIDPVAALELGLIPEVAEERVKPIGNAAWQGVFLCLSNRNMLREAARLTERIERLDLAANALYAAEFLPAMDFK